MNVMCGHDWHKERSAAWCPACGDRIDGKATLLNTSFAIALSEPLQVINEFTGQRRTVVWRGTNGQGTQWSGFYDDPSAVVRLSSVECQAWLLDNGGTAK